MRVNTIRIPCSDLKLSEAFYSVLLGRTKAFGGEEEGYVGFDLDNVTILLELEEAGEFEAGRYLGFSIEVDDIERLYRELKDRIAFVAPPEKQPWGGTMAHVEDTSGNSLSIVEAARA
jgi:predicted enzyme related to lactoylglutathione lyase